MEKTYPFRVYKVQTDETDSVSFKKDSFGKTDHHDREEGAG